ncbi:ATP-binding cassette domain-containing protein [Spongorhabdus nitratireducens]
MDEQLTHPHKARTPSAAKPDPPEPEMLQEHPVTTQSMSHIELRGVKTHNLKSIDLDIPKHKIVVFSGISGAGKSSVVFDTIYPEAQQQLIETFSTFARRRLPQFTRPPAESIRGISPCIVIDQKRLGASSRSTVGTATEIYTYMRMLFSRAGHPFIGWSHHYSFNNPDGMCPACKGLGKRMTVDIEKLLDLSKSIREGGILHPNYDIEKWYWREILWSDVVPFDTKLGEMSKEDMDRLLYADQLPIQYRDRGKLYKKKFDGVVRKLEQLHVDKDEDQIAGTIREAYDRLFHATICPDCNGVRLKQEALSVKLASGHRIGDLIDLELTELDEVLEGLADHPDYAHMREAVEAIVGKMRSSLSHLIDIGAGYLTLNRGVNTLSGGESQRVKMARQLDCGLVDLIYILDEPSVGLHACDIEHLIGMLRKLCNAGNSVLVVEHDTSIMRAADWLVEVGPVAGEKGGNVLYSGQFEGLLKADTPTGQALRTEEEKTPYRERRCWSEVWYIENATTNNLRNVTVGIPKGVLTCLTGVAGSGKSSLISEFIVMMKEPGMEGVIVIDQKPAGKTNRSNPATYIGIFDLIRSAFAETTGSSAGLFSFNSKGSCPECTGRGFVSMEMSFMDDVVLDCASCQGRRYRDDVLVHTYHDKSIHDVLEMTVEQALNFFRPLTRDKTSKAPKKSSKPSKKVGKSCGESRIVERLELLSEVGLSYLKLGQPLSTLSGGEAQRLKLSAELRKSGQVYVMDEPTTGLHPQDISRLLAIVERLLAAGNSVIIIEHNLDVIAAADWIIDIGPGGGKNGGTVVAEGVPEDIVGCDASVTGRYLSRLLGAETKTTLGSDL